MAVGVFNGRFSVGASAVSLDSLTGGTQTYNQMAFRRTSGTILIGNSGLTSANGFPLIQGETYELEAVSITGAALFLIGPGTVDFLGNSTA